MEFKSFIARSFTKEHNINRVSHLPKQNETELCNLVKHIQGLTTQTICGHAQDVIFNKRKGNRTCLWKKNPAYLGPYISNLCVLLLCSFKVRTLSRDSTHLLNHTTFCKSNKGFLERACSRPACLPENWKRVPPYFSQHRQLFLSTWARVQKRLKTRLQKHYRPSYKHVQLAHTEWKQKIQCFVWTCEPTQAYVLHTCMLYTFQRTW